MARFIAPKKSQLENESYVGFSGEVVAIPTVGLAVHDQKTPGGVLLTPQDDLNLAGVDNIVRNSNFQFSQNGTLWLGNSGPSTYIAAGWFMQHGGGSTSNAARQLGYEPTFKQSQHLRVTTITSNTDSSFSILSQRYARLKRYAGREMTVSYWIRCTTATSITGEVGLTFDDAGTSNRTALINRVSIEANVWQYVSETFTVPSISAADVINDGADHMYIYFWLEAGENLNDRTGGLQPLSASFDFANIKVEFGSRATTFNTMSYREEERKVMEYFEKSSRRQYFHPLALLTPNVNCGCTIQFNHPKWKTGVTFTPTTDFIDNLSQDAADAFGIQLRGTANNASSTARITGYVCDAEIQP